MNKPDTGTTYWMLWDNSDEHHRGNRFYEQVPYELNTRGAPDIRDLSVVDRAKRSIEWFNDTLREHERPRRLLKVGTQKVTDETLFEAPANNPTQLSKPD